MKKNTRLLFLPMLAVSLAGCSLLPLGGGSEQPQAVTKLVANQRVLIAMNQTMSSSLTSIELGVTADLGLSIKEFEGTATRPDSQTEIEANGTIALKAKNIRDSAAQASLVVTGDLKVTEDSVVTANSAVSAEGYYDQEWAYLKATGLDELLGTSEEEVKGKMHVGDISQFTNESPVAEQDTVPEVIPADLGIDMLMSIENVVATEQDGDLTVVYTITKNDIFNLFLTMITDEMESTMTASEIAEARNEFFAEMDEVLTINTAKITLGVSKDGYMNKFYVDLDVIVTNTYEENEVMMGKTVIHAVVDVKLNLTLNKPVTITLPSDLDTYPDITPEQPA